MIAVGSFWRNNAGLQIARYFRQVQALKDIGVEFRLIMVEGDSVDATRAQLEAAATALGVPWELVTRSHGGPQYGSTEEPARLTMLSWLSNGLLERVTDTDELLVYVESDLIWQADVVARLIALARTPYVDVIAPLVIAEGTRFYDIWAFRKDGVRFSPGLPYHAGLRTDTITEVDSVGSCLVMKACVARTTRSQTLALVEFCNNARAAGYHVWVDGRERIHHPF